MDRLGRLLDHVSDLSRQGYRPGSSPCSEGVALAALALCAHGREKPALEACSWLRDRQQPQGRVGISAKLDEPGWPTCWAILAWTAYHRAIQAQSLRGPFADAIESGLAWLGTISGRPLPRSIEMGHDTTLVGWPWVVGTHSWLEPTCLAVLAMRATREDQGERFREAVRLLEDRLLPTGGANYGNTLVFQQELLPHPQPTGLSLLALAKLTRGEPRVERSCEYLKRALQPTTATASLAYGLIGLDAQGAWIDGAETWVLDAADRTIAANGFQPGVSLALLAASRDKNPLWKIVRQPN
jgi:hypothetical protein